MNADDDYENIETPDPVTAKPRKREVRTCLGCPTMHTVHPCYPKCWTRLPKRRRVTTTGKP